MTKTIYTCDICHQEKKQDELAKIELRSTGGINIKNSNNFFGGGRLLDICSDCLKKYGFDVEAKHDDEYKKQAEQNRKTLEDKLLDILEDLGVRFEG